MWDFHSVIKVQGESLSRQMILVMKTLCKKELFINKFSRDSNTQPLKCQSHSKDNSPVILEQEKLDFHTFHG